MRQRKLDVRYHRLVVPRAHGVLALGACMGGVLLASCGESPPIDDAGAVDASCAGVILVSGACVLDDADDDDDGVPDVADCAPLDPDRAVALSSGACAIDDADDDDDGVADDMDCAPRDPDRNVTLEDGACASDDDDDDDDGVADDDDCAPRDAGRSVRLVDGTCAADDADDDDDGVPDADDCAPRDPRIGVALDDGSCAPNDGDADDDGVPDGVDCAPLDATRQIALTTGACVADDADDDDDGTADDDDCAPRDPAAAVALVTGACVLDDDDDDDDGASDDVDCAARDPAGAIALVNGACVADDADDDDDGTADDVDCAPRDPAGAIALLAGQCVPDDADDDDDGALDAFDCAPLDPALQLRLASGACAPDDADDDDDGVLDALDCAPLDASRQIALVTGACVADDADDDDDGVDDGLDCSALDPAYASGACSVGTSEVQPCGSSVGACAAGTRRRSCMANCQYDVWSGCGGALVPPAADHCGNGVDEDCDGAIDEGCGCAPVAPGTTGSFPVAGEIERLTVDDTRCLAYAIDLSYTLGEPSALVVMDTRSKVELTRIPFGYGVGDFDLSDDGARLAVARVDAGRIDVYAPPSWTPIASYPTSRSDPHAVEIGTGSYAFYAAGSNLYTLDLDTGASTRASFVSNTPRLELSPDETRLYVGAYNSQSTLNLLDVASDGTLTRTQRSETFAFVGFARPQLVVSRDGTRLAWAGAILDASDLAMIYGAAGMHLDAFDRTGRLLAGGAGVVDVERVRATPAPWASDTVAFVSGDQEIWWHDRTTGQMHYGHVADHVALDAVGERNHPPRPVASYDFVAVVADPIRPWVYGVDPVYGEVVVFDVATLTPRYAIEVGIVATDAVLDPSADALYVGHAETWAVARVDLPSQSFAGLGRAHQPPVEIASPRAGRVVTVGDYAGERVSLLDVAADAILDHAFDSYVQPQLVTSFDGGGFYLAESGSSRSCLYVMDTAGDVVTPVQQVACLDLPPVGVAAVPGTAHAFWAGARRDTVTGAIVCSVTETIHTVTPGGHLAISDRSIFDAATCARRAALPAISSAHALSADGRTLYLGRPGAILRVSLAPYLP